MIQTVKRLEELCYHSNIALLSASQIRGPERTVVYGSKTLRCPHQKKFTKVIFMSIESTLNVSKVSTFKVSNTFLENKMSKFGGNNVTLSFSVTQYLKNQTICLF